MNGKAIEEYGPAIAFEPSLPQLHYSWAIFYGKISKFPRPRVELEGGLVG